MTGIGYACLARGLPGTEMKTCRLQNATPENLTRLTGLNLQALRRLVQYNAASGIRLFRISSDLVPLGSHEANQVAWWDTFRDDLAGIGQLARSAGMRLSMHPGQYTILNALLPDVVERAIADLAYHVRVLDGLGTGADSKIILHIGGVYGDRNQALMRFRDTVGRLDDSIRRRLVIENDERHYGIADVLETGLALGLPVVFDNLHFAVKEGIAPSGADGDSGASNPAGMDGSPGPGTDGLSAEQWIAACRATWKPADGRQKIHYSQQAPDKKPGAHAATIRVRDFLDFQARLPDPDIDIMLEVKDKNLSAVKCSLCLDAHGPITALEQEWSRYKYSVLERSPQDYQAIRQLLKDKSAYPAAAFYGLVEDALFQPENAGYALNAAQHVWGYFKDVCSDGERQAFLALADGYRAGALPLSRLKAWLGRMAVRHQDPYLLASYYFLDLP